MILSRRLGVALVVTLFLLVTKAAQSSDWNSTLAGRSDRSGLSVETGPSTAALLWDGSTNAVYAGPPVIEGNTVISSRSESGNVIGDTWIVAQDLMTGALLWKTQVSAFFSGAWSSQVLGVRDGRVFATRASNGGVSEYLWALDVTTGAVLWRSELLIDEGGSEDGLAFTADGDLIHGNFLSVTRIDSKTGSTVWRMPRWCSGSGGCEGALAGARVYGWDFAPFGGTQKPVVSVWDVVTGVRQYSSPPGACDFGSQNVPFIAGDSVLAVCQSAAGASELVSFQDTGSSLVEKWRSPLPYLAFASFGVGPDGSIYSYSPNHELIRLDPATGQVLATSSPLDNSFGVFSPRLVVGSSGIVFVTSASTLYALNRDLTTRWSAAITGVAGAGIGGNGILVVPGSGTTLRAYDSRLSFYTVPGCRLIDTRVADSGGPLVANGVRAFSISGSCGVPSSAQTVALNITVTQPTTSGYLTVFRANTPVPPTSSLNYRMAQTRSVMTLAPIGALGELAVQCNQANGTADLVVDVLGYFE